MRRDGKPRGDAMQRDAIRRHALARSAIEFSPTPRTPVHHKESWEILPINSAAREILSRLARDGPEL